MIAFDGVAPIAKLEQQRNRRYKSWFQTQAFKKIKNASDNWDTPCITPGTEFMKTLNRFVTRYFSNFKQFNVKEIIVSGSDEPGEGEHKIYEYIRINDVYHKTTTTVIYGLDADLIMLTLNHLHISKKMYLFRETPHFIKTIDNTLNPNELYVIDIPSLEEEIINHLMNVSSTNANANQLTDCQRKCKVFDYILICFILNDL